MIEFHMEMDIGYKLDFRKRRLGLKSLNELIQAYTLTVQQGDLPLAYQGILEFMGRLQSRFAKSEYEVSSFCPGYMDMSYITMSTSLLQKNRRIGSIASKQSL